MTGSSWDALAPFWLAAVGFLTLLFARQISGSQARLLGRSDDARFLSRYLVLARAIGLLLFVVGAVQLALALLDGLG